METLDSFAPRSWRHANMWVEYFTKSKFSHLLSLLFSYYFIVLLLHDVAYVVVVGLGIFLLHINIFVQCR
jgi:hypothetical protein